MVHRLDSSVSVEERWLKQTSFPWSGSPEESIHSNTTRCDVTQAGYFLGMFFSTMMTIPSIPSWLTMFIDLVNYLFITNGSWILSNAFSLSKWQVVSVLHYINTFFPITEVECWSNTAILGKILHSPFQMFLDLVCWYCAEGVCITILDKYGSVAFWWCQVWLWYWGDIVLIGWVRKCSLLPAVYSGRICEG